MTHSVKQIKDTLIIRIRNTDTIKKVILEDMEQEELRTMYRDEEDCISRKEAIRIASGYCHPANVAKELEKLPSTQPERKKGRWILKKELVPLAYDTDPLNWDNYDEDTHSEWKEFYHCSECDWQSGWFEGGNYCKNCGADMRGDSE